MISPESNLVGAAPAVATDVLVRDEGNIWLVEARTEQARDWLAENISGEATQFAGRLVVEHRYIRDIVLGMQEAGLTVKQG